MSKNTLTTYKTGLAKTQETFVGMIQQSAHEMALSYDTYQISCARNMMSSMFELLQKEGMTMNDVDPNNVTDILQRTAMLKLNTAATPREVYVILRNVKINGQNTKRFEMGVEGDGNDKILREYGVGVQKVHNPWVIREGDDFTYPQFNGLEIKAPTWSPKSYTGKIVRVVYPIEMQDGSVEFHIAEREEVANNLKAHIANNLMWDKNKDTVLEKIADMTLDQLYEDKDALKIMSPAWRSAHSREAMFLRKMRNNATKKIPKDFGSAFIEAAHKQTFDDYDQYNNVVNIDPIERLDNEFEKNAGSEQVQIETINEQDLDEPNELTMEQVAAATEVEPLEKPKAKKAPFA